MHIDVLTAAVNNAGLILVAIVGAVGSIYAARAAHHAKRGREASNRAEGSARKSEVASVSASVNANAAREGVTNSHSTHLRDDLDTLAEKLDNLAEAVNAGMEAIWVELKGPPPTGSVKLPEGHR